MSFKKILAKLLVILAVIAFVLAVLASMGVSAPLLSLVGLQSLGAVSYTTWVAAGTVLLATATVADKDTVVKEVHKVGEVVGAVGESVGKAINKTSGGLFGDLGNVLKVGLVVFAGYFGYKILKDGK